MFVASQNKTIRDLLSANGFEKPNVKGVRLEKVHHGNPPEEMLKRMPYADFDKIAEVYYIQEYKIATPNVNYVTVMEFLRNVNYKGYGFFLNDVDITMDYAGSFDKYKCIDHITNFEDFREQGSMQNGEEYPRTVVDNDREVGKNCLTWMGLKTVKKYITKWYRC